RFRVREIRLAFFRRSLDPSDACGAARTLAESALEARNAGDPSLALAMERVAAAALLEHMRPAAENLAPEAAADWAGKAKAALEPVLSEAGREIFVQAIDGFLAVQRDRFRSDVADEAERIARAASQGGEASLGDYLRLAERLAAAAVLPDFPSGTPASHAEAADYAALEQLERLSRLVGRAVGQARSVLSHAEETEPEFDSLRRQAETEDSPSPALVQAAVSRIQAAEAEAEELLDLRNDLFSRVQAEMRRERRSPGVRLAWAMLRIGFSDPEVEIDPAGFRQDARQAAMRFRMRGLPVEMEMGEDDLESAIRAKVADYEFVSGWYPLFHKPLSWMVGLAEDMRRAGAPGGKGVVWEIIEGPGAPLALSRPPAAAGSAPASLAPASGRLAFFQGRLRQVEEMPRSDDSRRLIDDFLAAARRLHDGVMEDASIPQELRQALKPVLAGAYEKPDPRDYFDSAFCRRLLEADYLETFIRPFPPALREALDAYRGAVGKLDAGNDSFAFEAEDGERLVAVERLDFDQGGSGRSGDQDPETGETLPAYVWRRERERETVFYSPLPSRYVYAFMLAEHYDGRHAVRPVGRPALTEVWHLEKGRLASYAAGGARAEGDAELWNQAIAWDLSGRFDPAMGSPGWNFPLHVIERNDQGDPLTLATLSGVVKSPDFSGIADTGARRRAEDEWLAAAAAALPTPGELGLIFHHLFRYCSDSPLPELPNLIGSHFGLSDYHQTVYESLERRWVGRLTGDCDDLAEFFQILTRLQGKLSHVMQLPSHAACGYVEKDADGLRRFVVLQTGPVLVFAAPSLNEVVETAYRSFDRGDNMTHMTTDAVPLLLRFADEETRTPFVLAARIYEDAEYADTMIRVQSYWHEHVYSAAIKVMEEMIQTDQEVGNIKEIGSLYERVGEYARSADMRRRELELVKGNPQAELSTLLEIAQLHVQDKDRDKALAALGEMEEIMRAMIKRDDANEFFRAMSFRSLWAVHLSRLGQPARAWALIRYDAAMTKSRLGRVADPVLRTLVSIYERMRLQAASGAAVPAEEAEAAREIRRELEEGFGRGYFKSDDSYNAIIGRFHSLGRYAVADAGRDAGLARLAEDGPYPDGPRDQSRRARGVDDEDWKWLRITPQLYLALALEMLDPDEYPELHNPDSARILLEGVTRAARKGIGLGSDISGDDAAVRAEITLAFLNRDIAAFRRSLAVVKDKDYSSLYDDAAMTFGLQCGLIPPAEFPAWIAAFREFFPGSQHYFKVVYRAIDKENYDHALLMAEATAGFFPDKPLLLQEAEFVRGLIPGLKARKAARGK
ncbi:MAG: hypothetical protein LBV15_03135, partial [Planctomycetota bacterium]|nr:hypothetical protein [Planctomycetota bacterium]